MLANTTQMTASGEDDFIVLDEDDFFEVSGGNTEAPPSDRTGFGTFAGSTVPVKSAS